MGTLPSLTFPAFRYSSISNTTWLAAWLWGSRPGMLAVAQLVPLVKDTVMPRSSAFSSTNFKS